MIGTALPARLLFLQWLGGWLLVLGIGLTLVGGFAVVSQVPENRLLPALANLANEPAFRGLVLATGTGVLLLLVGMALYVGVPGFDARLARRDYDRPRTILAALAAVFVLGNVLGAPALLLPGALEAAQSGRALPSASLVVAMLATQLALLVVLGWRIVRPGVITFEAMGLTLRNVERQLNLGLIGGVAIFCLAIVVGLLMRGLGVQQTQMQMFESLRQVPLGVFLIVLLVTAVLAPVAEESFFRGYIFTALRGRYGRPLAYVGSALLFAAIHFNLPALVPILLMAVGLTYLYDRSGSVVPGIIAHGINNGFALVILRLAPDLAGV